MRLSKFIYLEFNHLMYDYTLDKNMKVKYIDHHQWPTMKHFKITLKQSQKETFGPENK